MSWRHSGFNVFCVSRIQPGDEKTMKILVQYIIRASFSQERATTIPDESKAICKSKDAKEEKTFNAFEWLAAMDSHVPNKGEQMVRYYGYYTSHVAGSRGKRKKGGSDQPFYLDIHLTLPYKP
ncbi:MAG: transposase [Deltaproteobacteria bacterium]|nr:transposase [Deltaproteobacteria bacterium]